MTPDSQTGLRRSLTLWHLVVYGIVIIQPTAIKSFIYLLDKPVPFRAAPDSFCLDLCKYFDVDQITAIAAPTAIRNAASIQDHP
jgi:hypothetical protein